MMISALTFGSQAPDDVSQCVLFPLPVVFAQSSAFFIMNVPVRTRVPWPETSAWFAGGLVTVALPSRKTVPFTTNRLVPFHESCPARVLHEYETPAGVRLI